MQPCLSKLVEIGGLPFVPEQAGADALVPLGDIGVSLRNVLARKNGFFCFESALRVFPSITTDASWGLTDWNAYELWKGDYGGLADDMFAFAEDVFGCQFVVRRGEIATFDPETGEYKMVAASLEEWASRLLIDYGRMTGYPIARQWQARHGPLHPRYRLMPKKPFVVGGAYDIDNLVAVDSVRLMKNLGNLARQIRELPDGTQIEFKLL